MTDNTYSYDERCLSESVKTLAHCFNVVACGDVKNETSAVNHAQSLYKHMTGDEQPVSLSRDDNSFLRRELMKVASRLQGGGSTGWAEYGEVIMDHVEQLYEAAVERKLISAPAPGAL